MYILNHGGLVEETDIHDNTLADFEEQVVHWLRLYLDSPRESIDITNE